MKVMKHHQGAGKLIHRHFETISTMLMVIFILSIFFTALGFYNYFAYGNCNGQDSNEACILSPETYQDNPLYLLFPPSPEQVKMVSYENLPRTGTEGAPVTIVEVGCFTCPYTKAREVLVEELLEKKRPSCPPSSTLCLIEPKCCNFSGRFPFTFP